MKAAMIPLRRWATPLTIGAFLLMPTTGILMFFEWDRGLTVVVHQWFSWFFLLGAGGHIAANIRPLKNHLKSRGGMASVTAFAAVLVLSFFAWGFVTGPQLEKPIEEALVDAPLSALARVSRIDPDAVTRRLKARGIATDGGESIRTLAGKYRVGPNRLLAMVFLPE